MDNVGCWNLFLKLEVQQIKTISYILCVKAGRTLESDDALGNQIFLITSALPFGYVLGARPVPRPCPLSQVKTTNLHFGHIVLLWFFFFRSKPIIFLVIGPVLATWPKYSFWYMCMPILSYRNNCRIIQISLIGDFRPMPLSKGLDLELKKILIFKLRNGQVQNSLCAVNFLDCPIHLEFCFDFSLDRHSGWWD